MAASNSMCKFDFKLLNFENVLRQYCYLSQLSHMKISTVKTLVFMSLVYCCSLNITILLKIRQADHLSR